MELHLVPHQRSRPENHYGHGTPLTSSAADHNDYQLPLDSLTAPSTGYYRKIDGQTLSQNKYQSLESGSGYDTPIRGVQSGPYQPVAMETMVERGVYQKPSTALSDDYQQLNSGATSTDKYQSLVKSTDFGNPQSDKQQVGPYKQIVHETKDAPASYHSLHQPAHTNNSNGYQALRMSTELDRAYQLPPERHAPVSGGDGGRYEALHHPQGSIDQQYTSLTSHA